MTELKHIPVNWGAATPQERGPLIVLDANGYARNVIGRWGGPYRVFFDIAIAKRQLTQYHTPHLANSTFVPLPRPSFEAGKAHAEGVGIFDASKLSSMDPLGFRPHEYFGELMQAGAQIMPMISATPDEMRIERIAQDVRSGAMKPDGVVVREDGYTLCTKIATNPVWHLPSIAKLFEMQDSELRGALFEATNNRDFIDRPDLEVYLPPYEGTSLYVFGDLKRLANPETMIGMRVHDACRNSDIHDSSRCTCKAYLDFAKEEGVKIARAGGVFVLAYRPFDGRAFGEVIKTGVYASRESGTMADTAEFYFPHTESYVGGEDIRPHAFLAESMQLLGITHVDVMYSMSDSKFDNIVKHGVTIGQRIPLPADRVPPRAWQEVVGKVDAGYNPGQIDYAAEAAAAGYVPGEGLRHRYAGVPSTLSKDDEVTLKYCGLSGVDDNVRIRDLNKLAKRFPFMEAGILWSPEHAGQPRFPSLTWINRFLKRYTGAHSAIHLCGSALVDFAAGEGYTVHVATSFKRVQLNLRFEEAGKKIRISDLIEQIEKHPTTEFIVQYGKDDKALLALFAKLPNVSIFHDVSAGAGKLAGDYEPPIKGHFTGYAGGLGPYNLAREIKRIQKVAPGATVWVDAETNLRGENSAFDISKAEQFLAVAETFVAIENRVAPVAHARNGHPSHHT